MSLWLKARHVPHLVTTLVAVGVLQNLLTGTVLVVPVLIGSVGASVWSMFLPVMVGVAVADSLASKTQGVEARVSRHVLILDVGLLLATAICTAIILLALGGTHSEAVGTIGQSFAAVGIAASVTLWWGLGPGVLAPLAVAVVCLAYGSDAPGGGYVRLLAPDSSAWWDLTVGLTATAVGVALTATRTVRVNLRRADQLG